MESIRIKEVVTSNMHLSTRLAGAGSQPPNLFFDSNRNNLLKKELLI